jgi:hypothetical protein
VVQGTQQEDRVHAVIRKRELARVTDVAIEPGAPAGRLARLLDVQGDWVDEVHRVATLK